jgi:CRP-like cAMP-binding protein
MKEARLRLLQSMPVFGGVDAATLSLLLANSPIVTVQKGQYFFHENEQHNSMFVLEKGKVSVLKTWQGRDYVLHHLAQGDCFGEMALIDLQPRSASVLAVEACRAIEIPPSALHEVCQHDVEQFALIYMNIARELSRRLRHSDERLFESRVQAEVIDGNYFLHSV